MKNTFSLMVVLTVSSLILFPYINSVYAVMAPPGYVGTAHIRYIDIEVTYGVRHIYRGAYSYDVYLNNVDGSTIIWLWDTSYNIVYMSNRSGYVHIVAIENGEGYRTFINIYFKMGGLYQLYYQYVEYDEIGRITFSEIYIETGTILYEPMLYV